MNKRIVLFFILLSLSCSLLYFPDSVKSQTNVTNLDLTFHGNSILMSYSNGSLIAYEGVDGAPPTKTSAVKADLVSQISGTQMGITYWSGIVIWAVQLPMDLQVKGNVAIHAYISSNYALSGFFSGGGYGMAVVDIDENANLGQQFLTQAPYTIGSNPFSSTPTKYSLSVPVDYTFKKGHYIGFAVGLGATSQGFIASVYFDSADRNSGVTLPVVDNFKTQTAEFDSKIVGVTSNSAVTNIQYNSNSRTISFSTNGIKYTPGQCTVAVPKSLMQSPFQISQGSKVLTTSLSQNDTYYTLSFTHVRNEETILIASSSSTQTPSPTSGTTITPTPTEIQPSNNPTQSSSSNTTSPTPEIPEFDTLLLLIGILSLVTIIMISMMKIKNKKSLETKD